MSTIIGPNGEDIPLRKGQHDAAVYEGFGIAHIQDGHGGFVPEAHDIEYVIYHAPGCGNDLVLTDKNTECTAEIDGHRMKVVVTGNTRDVPNGRPLGVITAFYI
ncbi:hypothetical protein ACUY3K_02605 [Corynebacterium uberis]